MSEQRIDSGAQAGARGDADPEEGQGLATPGAHSDAADRGAAPATTGEGGVGRGGPTDPLADADTEGERYVQGTRNRADDLAEEVPGSPEPPG
jgi:hypothetical protein